jgi:hypothetical protein
MPKPSICTCIVCCKRSTPLLVVKNESTGERFRVHRDCLMRVFETAGRRLRRAVGAAVLRQVK